MESHRTKIRKFRSLLKYFLIVHFIKYKEKGISFKKTLREVHTDEAEEHLYITTE